MMRSVRPFMMQHALAGASLIALLALAYAGSSVPSVARADPTNDTATLQLAMRYIQRQTTGATIELLAGAVPGDMPVTLPLPQGARVIGTAIRRGPTHDLGWDIFLDTSGNPNDATSFFQDALQSDGWTPPPPFTPSVASGFQNQRPANAATPTPSPTVTPNPTRNLSLCQAGGAISLTVAASPLNTATGVSIHVDPTGGRCIPIRRTTSGPRLPILSAPPDIDVLLNNESTTTSDAVAQTGMSAADLEAFYSRQLATAGWTHVAGDATGPLAWSVWNVPDTGGQQAYLSVLEIAGKNIRDLHIQIGAAAYP
jgi:hypothetical protein